MPHESLAGLTHGGGLCGVYGGYAEVFWHVSLVHNPQRRSSTPYRMRNIAVATYGLKMERRHGRACRRSYKGGRRRSLLSPIYRGKDVVSGQRAEEHLSRSISVQTICDPTRMIYITLLAIISELCDEK